MPNSKRPYRSFTSSECAVAITFKFVRDIDSLGRLDGSALAGQAQELALAKGLLDEERSSSIPRSETSLTIP